MTATNFDEALRRVLAHEGGFSNHPSDPGGPTNFGITIADYRKYVKREATAADVRDMQREDAMEIYRQEYWRPLRCDDLPSGVDYAVFDYGVNSGPSRAGKVMRRLLKLSTNSAGIDDGVVAAAFATDSRQLVVAICDERLGFLQSLKTWPVFGAGWSRRVAEVKAAALAMAKAGSLQQKGTATAKIIVTGAVIAAGAAAGSTDAVPTSTTVLIVAGGLIAASAAWLAWRVWRRRYDVG